ncbi:hypothetical protein SAMN05428969_0653 [Devosia sp. YR412]|nr:hypothetical protein SAMN05428969_0653 [Devosia sp. YR412]
MAWIYVKLPCGTLKVKPRSHMRRAERFGELPMLDLGVVIISWWSRKRLLRHAKLHRRLRTDRDHC